MRPSIPVLLALGSFAAANLLSCADEAPQISRGENALVPVSSEGPGPGPGPAPWNPCDDCPKLLSNGSFETVNGPVPGGLMHFNQGLVPSWISVSASPTILDQSGFPTLNYTLPHGYDGDYVAMMGVTALNLNPNGYWTEALANSVLVHGDEDLVYHLKFKHFAVAYEQGFNLRPAKFVAYISSDVPAYQGTDSLSEFDITDHSHQEVGSTPVSVGEWDQFRTSFTPAKDRNQLTIVPYFQEQHPGNTAKAFTHIDDVELSCSTNALVGIHVDFSGNALHLSAVFDGLPSDVDITEYAWTLNNLTKQTGYYSTEAEPVFDGVEFDQSDNYEVCVDIVDSRSCCAQFCKKIVPPPTCEQNTLEVNADDFVFEGVGGGTYYRKGIQSLRLRTCDNEWPELWGIEDWELACSEVVIFDDTATAGCGPYSNACDPEALLILGQSKLSAICPGASLAASNDYKTWTMTLPLYDSCGIRGLRLQGNIQEFDSSCDNLGGTVDQIIDQDDCHCED